MSINACCRMVYMVRCMELAHANRYAIKRRFAKGVTRS